MASSYNGVPVPADGNNIGYANGRCSLQIQRIAVVEAFGPNAMPDTTVHPLLGAR